MPHHARAPRLAVVILLCAVPGAAAAAQPARALPKVRVVATGGTIAGEQREPGTLGSYEIKKSVNDIVSLIPNVQRYAEVETEQFSNLPSPSVTPAHWLRLAQRINALLKERPDLAGIVVTHGTARLEETAFFLYLTVKSDRPVVVVGAQRPPTGISPDGPINLLSARRVAAVARQRGDGGDGRPHHLGARRHQDLRARRRLRRRRDGHARHGGDERRRVLLSAGEEAHGVERLRRRLTRDAAARRHQLLVLGRARRSRSGCESGDCRDHRLRAGRGQVLRGAAAQGRHRRGDVSLRVAGRFPLRRGGTGGAAGHRGEAPPANQGAHPDDAGADAHPGPRRHPAVVRFLLTPPPARARLP